MLHGIRSAALASACLAAVAGVGCGATTRISDSWANPASRDVSFGKVAAVALEKDMVRRKILEDAMAAELQNAGTPAIASYTLIPPDALPDRDLARKTLTTAGADAVVMMRMTGTDEPITFVPGTAGYATYYGTPWGYYGYWGAAVWDPGYVRLDENVRVETVVYSLKTDQMVWAGLSETLNPNNARALVSGVGKAATRDMRRSGVIR